jgi:hypothetical protein
MIVLDFEQGSDGWIAARLGLPTASQFHRVLTPRTMKLSASAEPYAHELLAEEMLNHPIDEQESMFMTRGSELERDAVRFYEFTQDTATQRVGFILRDDGRVGCSPDRFVGNDGGLEIKCYNAANHVGAMLHAEEEKARCQIQGALWITGRRWWDRLSYNPELPCVITRSVRDEEFISKLAAAVNQFIEYLSECRAKLIREGFMTEGMIEARNNRRRELGILV